MRNNEDQRIQAIFPHVMRRTVIYLGDSYALPVGVMNSIRRLFSSIGYRFIYFPDLLNDLSPEILAYLFPGFGRKDLLSLEDQIKRQAGLDGRTGFLYKKSRFWRTIIR